MWNTASLQHCSAASNREGRGGGRQGTASLLRLPQFLFNCLLIYLIMLTTRTTGQAARVLLLKQFIALRLLLLNNSPSLLDLYHIQWKHRTSLSPSASLSGSSKMAWVAEATLPQDRRGRRPRTQGICKGLRLEKHLHVDLILRSEQMLPQQVPLPTRSALINGISTFHTDSVLIFKL